jgi:hypothetical protein
MLSLQTFKASPILSGIVIGFLCRMIIFLNLVLVLWGTHIVDIELVICCVAENFMDCLR